MNIIQSTIMIFTGSDSTATFALKGLIVVANYL